ncbi:MAG TPA: AAA family ATPase [Sphingomicrobium sp.]|nr:AAA family ATPase [Sphingomicrobium sp.]
MMKRGFLLGKFMPPHAGHMALIDAARRLVDELTILVCWLPGDQIAGEQRLEWMRSLFPGCRVVGHGAPVPQAPDESPHFWPIWRSIVAKAHPEPITYLFAGEDYGAELARQVGGLFVPLGARVLKADQDGLGGLQASDIRADPWKHWGWLPPPVRDHYALTICLHGVESVGKSVLAERLAAHYGTIVVPEYGRVHCEVYGTDCREQDLLLIGQAQQAMIEAARPWCNRRLIVDTDSLMTAAWSQMMIGYAPDELICAPKADLYLMLDIDAPFIDDGTRVYREPEQRAKFHRVARQVLAVARAPTVDISGSWDERFETACAAIDSLDRGRT